LVTLETPPLPTMLMAATLKSYVSPLSRPEIKHDVVTLVSDEGQTFPTEVSVVKLNSLTL
jgi:hypothetical protein